MIYSEAERPDIKLFGAPIGFILLLKWPVGGPRRAQRFRNGSVMPIQERLAIWNSMGCFESSLVPYKTSSRAKCAL